jgi:hypothetical protein
MKNFALALLAGVVLCGCASPAQKLEARKKERYAAYAALPPEMKTEVDKGQIKVGMPMDAVYIAWGPPSQILTGESSGGKTITWLYHGTYLQEYRYWSYRPYYYGRHSYPYSGPYLDYDYYPRSYMSAEIIFENDVVKQWRNMPRPY